MSNHRPNDNRKKEKKNQLGECRKIIVTVVKSFSVISERCHQTIGPLAKGAVSQIPQTSTEALNENGARLHRIQQDLYTYI
jgi:hypothetical protein